jgi:hypothetical protein
MTSKAIFEAALKLPTRTKARLVGKLLDSLGEPDWEECLLAGAKVAEQRLSRVTTGKTKGIPEEEAHRRLFAKKNP